MLATISHSRSISNDGTTVGPQIATFERQHNANGSLHRTAATVNDDAVQQFIAETYEFGYSNGRRNSVTFTDLAAGASPKMTPIALNSGGNDTHGADDPTAKGIGPRLYSETVPGGTRSYSYDKEGRVVKTIDSLAHVDGDTSVGTSETIENTWDHRSRLVEVKRHIVKTVSSSGHSAVIQDDRSVTQYFYDALNRRIGRRRFDLDDAGAKIADSERVTGTAHDLSGEAFDLTITSGGGKIYQSTLNGLGGVLAIDQSDPYGDDGFDAPVSAWLFADLDGTAAATASVDASGAWHSVQRRISREGKVLQTNGGNGVAALEDIPVVWHGLRLDTDSNLYLTATAGIGPDAGLVSYQSPSAIGFWDGWNAASTNAEPTVFEGGASWSMAGRDYVAAFNPSVAWNDGTFVGKFIGAAQYVNAAVTGGAALIAGGLAMTGTGAVTVAAGGMGLSGTTTSTLAIGGGMGMAFGGGAALYRGEDLSTAAILSVGGGMLGGSASRLAGTTGTLRTAMLGGGFGGSAEGGFRAVLQGRTAGGIAYAMAYDGVLGVATGGILDRAIIGISRGSAALRAASSQIDVAPNRGAFGPRSIGAAENPVRTVEVRIRDLVPLDDAAHTAPRPYLRRLTDEELLTAARDPSNLDSVVRNTRTGRLHDGNGRVIELQRRAADRRSGISPDDLIPVEDYTPDLSMFWDLD